MKFHKLISLAAVPFSRYAGNVAEAVRKSSVADKRDSIPSDPSVAVRSLRSASRSRADYAVGSIPMSSDVTDSGARTYCIPIATAAGWNFAPSLGLCYSSQGGAGEADPAKDAMFTHEYGHTKQSKIFGHAYLSAVGVPSIIGAGFHKKLGHDHHNEWYEVWANNLSDNYLSDNGYLAEAESFEKSTYPSVQNPDWYFYSSIAYYAGLLSTFLIFLF